MRKPWKNNTWINWGTLSASRSSLPYRVCVYPKEEHTLWACTGKGTVGKKTAAMRRDQYLVAIAAWSHWYKSWENLNLNFEFFSLCVRVNAIYLYPAPRSSLLEDLLVYGSQGEHHTIESIVWSVSSDAVWQTGQCRWLGRKAAIHLDILGTLKGGTWKDSFEKKELEKGPYILKKI